MNKIAFFKNNKKENINEGEITYLEADLILRKENSETVITLDFKAQKCELFLKNENFKMAIPVLEMTSKNEVKQVILEYTLVSDPDAKNTIIITTNLE